MLRDKNLIPLSHQHQHALALCVRIDRASPIKEADVPAWQSEIAQHFRNEIAVHFAAEEQVLFPAGRRFAELIVLLEDLSADHEWLRQRFDLAIAGKMSSPDITEMAQRLSTHIRKEEREFFERLQQLLDANDLSRLGQALDKALAQSEQACIVQSDATRLRPAK